MVLKALDPERPIREADIAAVLFDYLVGARELRHGYAECLGFEVDHYFLFCCSLYRKIGCLRNAVDINSLMKNECVHLQAKNFVAASSQWDGRLH